MYMIICKLNTNKCIHWTNFFIVRLAHSLINQLHQDHDLVVKSEQSHQQTDNFRGQFHCNSSQLLTEEKNP